MWNFKLFFVFGLRLYIVYVVPVAFKEVIISRDLVTETESLHYSAFHSTKCQKF